MSFFFPTFAGGMRKGIIAIGMLWAWVMGTLPMEAAEKQAKQKEKAEKQALDVDYRLGIRGGAIMPDGKVDAMVGTPGAWVPSAGADFSVSFAPDWQSLRDWNNARIGVGVSWWKLGVTGYGLPVTGDGLPVTGDIMGHAIAPYAFVEIPFYKSKHFEIGIRPGVGCSFITKTYYNTTTEEQRYNELQAPGINRSVGSVFNYYFPEELYFNFPIKDGWTIGIAGGWYHMSNGSIKQPNSGYNIFGGELAVRYRPNIGDWKLEIGDSLRTLRKWEVEMAVSGAARQVYYKDRQTFFCSEIQVAAYWRAHTIFRLGGGIDVFYDGAYYDRPTKFGKTYLKGATQADCWRVGVSVQPEFVMGKFTAGFHFGVYLYDPVKNREVESKDAEAHADLWENGNLQHKGIFYKYDLLNAGSAGYPDGWLYTQIALRYRLPYHLFVHATMKAHLTKVEFVAAGLGVYL